MENVEVGIRGYTVAKVGINNKFFLQQSDKQLSMKSYSSSAFKLRNWLSDHGLGGLFKDNLVEVSLASGIRLYLCEREALDKLQLGVGEGESPQKLIENGVRSAIAEAQKRNVKEGKQWGYDKASKTIYKLSWKNNVLEEIIYKPEKMLGRGCYGRVHILKPVTGKGKSKVIKFAEKSVKGMFTSLFSGQTAFGPMKVEKESLETMSLVKRAQQKFKFVQQTGLDSGFAVAKQYSGTVDHQVRNWNGTERSIAIRHMAEGVYSIHEKGICHRDIKLENTLFRGEGNSLEVVISDFGSARKKDKESDQIKDYIRLGVAMKCVALGSEMGSASSMHFRRIRNFPLNLDNPRVKEVGLSPRAIAQIEKLAKGEGTVAELELELQQLINELQPSRPTPPPRPQPQHPMVSARPKPPARPQPIEGAPILRRRV